MVFDDLMRIIQKVNIVSKELTNQKALGLHNSPFRGRGIVFDSVRKYEIGDDIRTINWNVTAKFKETYVNTFKEDKERLIWLLIDISGSVVFGTDKYSKWELEQILSASIAFSSIKANNAVGVIFFSNKVEGCIRPAKGMTAFGYIARNIIDFKPNGNATDIIPALELLMSSGNKCSLVFILSDFITQNYKTYCKLLMQKHELIAIRVYDKMETCFSDLGWVNLKDAENMSSNWINTSSAKIKNSLIKNFEDTEKYFYEVFSINAHNILNISTNDDPVEKLVRFMYNR